MLVCHRAYYEYLEYSCLCWLVLYQGYRPGGAQSAQFQPVRMPLQIRGARELGIYGWPGLAEERSWEYPVAGLAGVSGQSWLGERFRECSSSAWGSTRSPAAL